MKNPSLQQHHKNHLLGIGAVMLFNLLCAGQEVYLGSLLQKVHPGVLLFICMGTMMVFYNLLQINNPRRFFNLIRKNPKTVIALNLSSAIGWTCYFISIKHLEPAVEGAISLAIGPIVILALIRLWGEGDPISALDVVAALGILLSVSFLSFSGNKGLSAVGEIASNEFWMGITAALIGGIAITISSYVSKRAFNRGGWNPIDPLSVRFYLLVISSFFFLPGREEFAFLNEPKNLINTMLLAFAGFIGPMYLVQIAIRSMDPFFASLLFSMNPMFTLLLQVFDSRLSFSMESIIGVTFCILFTCIGVLESKIRSTVAKSSLRDVFSKIKNVLAR